MRLTIKLKSEIVNNALKKAGVLIKWKMFEEKLAILAEKVRIEAWGGQENYDTINATVERINGIISTIPAKYRNHDIFSVGGKRKNIHVAFGGRQVRLPYDGKGTGDYNITKYTPYDRLLLPAEHTLSLEFEALMTERDNINELQQTIETKVKAKLDEATTVKKLLQLWPEASELLPNPEPKSLSTQLTVPVKDLNSLLGLGDK